MTVTVDPNVAIIEENIRPVKTEQLHITPNPVAYHSDRVRLHIPQSIVGDVSISIYDAVGTLLDRQNVNVRSDKSYYWDLTNRSSVKVGSGSYLVMVRGTNIDGKMEGYKALVGVKR